jgi:hypothetical protein
MCTQGGGKRQSPRRRGECQFQESMRIEDGDVQSKQSETHPFWLVVLVRPRPESPLRRPPRGVAEAEIGVVPAGAVDAVPRCDPEEDRAARGSWWAKPSRRPRMSLRGYTPCPPRADRSFQR